MTTQEKCEAILRKALEIANDKGRFCLEDDFGGFTATVVAGNDHTHVGVPNPDGSWELFVETLYNALHEGPGLSWA